MCVDYTNLNKACKKDLFGLPRNDQVVDSIADCSLLSFLDCYSVYHSPSRWKTRSRHLPFDAFCCTTIPFRLKSVASTYQWDIQWCLYSQLGHNAEAYVNDVVVKTWEEERPISDLAETFDNLRKFKMKLNLEKSTFGVPSGKLLVYMVSCHGIDPNLENVSAITKMKLP
jgi:hypothetical protein